MKTLNTLLRIAGCLNLLLATLPPYTLVLTGLCIGSGVGCLILAEF